MKIKAMPPVKSKVRKNEMKSRSILLLMFLTGIALSDEFKSGMLFGGNHSYYFTAPDGWILDNKSGVSQGLHMVFYPEGETWANSPVIAYGRSVSKNDNLTSIQDQVKQTVKDFHDNGSPKYKAMKHKTVKIDSGKSAEIYFFEGDKWGNYEAVGYIEENSGINFLVYNSSSKGIFENHKTKILIG
ncbi:MAG: hypothetical protein JW795_17890 [Chitinivibrionales bacterium]|nr:hypothetical protein [Chitinivibrionales bacterium]